MLRVREKLCFSLEYLSLCDFILLNDTNDEGSGDEKSLKASHSCYLSPEVPHTFYFKILPNIDTTDSRHDVRKDRRVDSAVQESYHSQKLFDYFWKSFAHEMKIVCEVVDWEENVVQKSISSLISEREEEEEEEEIDRFSSSSSFSNSSSQTTPHYSFIPVTFTPKRYLVEGVYSLTISLLLPPLSTTSLNHHHNTKTREEEEQKEVFSNNLHQSSTNFDFKSNNNKEEEEEKEMMEEEEEVKYPILFNQTSSLLESFSFSQFIKSPPISLSHSLSIKIISFLHATISPSTISSSSSSLCDGLNDNEIEEEEGKMIEKRRRDDEHQPTSTSSSSSIWFINVTNFHPTNTISLSSLHLMISPSEDEEEEEDERRNQLPSPYSLHISPSSSSSSYFDDLSLPLSLDPGESIQFPVTINSHNSNLSNHQQNQKINEINNNNNDDKIKEGGNLIFHWNFSSIDDFDNFDDFDNDLLLKNEKENIIENDNEKSQTNNLKVKNQQIREKFQGGSRKRRNKKRKRRKSKRKKKQQKEDNKMVEQEKRENLHQQEKEIGMNDQMRIEDEEEQQNEDVVNIDEGGMRSSNSSSSSSSSSSSKYDPYHLNSSSHNQPSYKYFIPFSLPSSSQSPSFSYYSYSSSPSSSSPSSHNHNHDKIINDFISPIDSFHILPISNHSSSHSSHSSSSFLSTIQAELKMVNFSSSLSLDLLLISHPSFIFSSPSSSFSSSSFSKSHLNYTMKERDEEEEEEDMTREEINHLISLYHLPFPLLCDDDQKNNQMRKEEDDGGRRNRKSCYLTSLNPLIHIGSLPPRSSHSISLDYLPSTTTISSSVSPSTISSVSQSLPPFILVDQISGKWWENHQEIFI